MGVGFAEKEAVGLDPSPVFNYLTGSDSLYVCNPIKLDGSHSCLHLSQHQLDLAQIDPSLQFLIGLLMFLGYHYALVRLVYHIGIDG